jgi:hypothetical protein
VDVFFEGVWGLPILTFKLLGFWAFFPKNNPNSLKVQKFPWKVGHGINHGRIAGSIGGEEGTYKSIQGILDNELKVA